MRNKVRSGSLKDALEHKADKKAASDRSAHEIGHTPSSAEEQESRGDECKKGECGYPSEGCDISGAFLYSSRI
jgi:hypothetical protein